MAFHFTIGALALAAEGANAVGAVRFTLRDDMLEIDLLRVGSYRESFLPGALTEAVRFAVPYTAVRGLVRRGAVLYLALDPKVASPYHRFALTRFTDMPMDALIGAHHRRMRARLAALLLPAPVSTLALVVAPPFLVAGALGKASLAIVVGLATWAACRAALSVRTHGGPLDDEFRDAFEQRVLERLGLRPAWLADEAPFDAPITHAVLARAESAPRPLRGQALGFPRTPFQAQGAFPPPLARAANPSPASPPPGWPSARPEAVPPAKRTEVALLRVSPPPLELPRERVAPLDPGHPGPLPLSPGPSPWALALASPGLRRAGAGALGLAALAVLALSAGRALIEPDAAPAGNLPPTGAAGETWAQALAGTGTGTGAAPGASGSSAAGAIPVARRSTLPRCACERSDSPLWTTPPPVLSILPIPTRRKESGGLEDDIAPRPDRRGRSRYEFDLAIVNNGKAELSDVKLVLTFARRDDRGERTGVTDRGLFWEGALRPGRAVKWTVKAPGTELRIDSDETRTLADTAPADGDAFHGLLRANQPVVRLHGATMLAYVGDRRAEAAARALDGLSAGQEGVREMVVRAASPVRVCSAKVTADTLEVCVHNTTDSAVVEPALVEPSAAGQVAGQAANGRRVTLDATIPPHEGLRATFPGFGPAAAELAVAR